VVHAAGLIIRELSPIVSNWRSEKSLQEYLVESNTVAIADLDTRKLTRILREKGALNGCIVSGDNIDEKAAVEKAKAFPGLKGMDLAKEVSTDKNYQWNDGVWSLEDGYAKNKDGKFHVVAYDFGAKHNILRLLVDRGCKLTVVPAQTPAAEVLKMNPDGVFLSNGPGDPEPCDYAIQSIKEILDADIPMFGICLGHQLLALASGAQTVKMKFGHHGANHPVQDLNNKRVMITSQNHGFAVDEASLPSCLEATHKSLFDQYLQGIRRTDKDAFSFQGHTEASPGPRDVEYLFDQFAATLERRAAQ
jgi:carbamoyl-phosphate synthase small subunit